MRQQADNRSHGLVPRRGTTALFLLRRLSLAALLVFAASSAALVLAGSAPGDYATGELGVGARPEAVAQLRARYGLDRPVLEQYGRWLANAARLDFGRSMAFDRPVADLIPERAANTALLAVAALVVATAIGLPLGVLTGSQQGGWLLGALRTISVLLLSMPPLLTSLGLIFLAARTGWLPIGGMRSIEVAGSGLWDLARHMAIPVLALALPLAAMFERFESGAIREAIAQPFIRAARARGIPRSRVVWRHALKVAARPLLGVYGVAIGSLLSGSFVVEVVTSWPGLGSLMLNALRSRDVFLVAGCASAGSLFLAAGTLLSDVALAVVDPRSAE